MKFAEELRLYQFSLGEDKFDELLNEIRRVIDPDLNTEQFLYHPKKSLMLCEILRYRGKSPKVPDDLILRRLQNLRKSSRGGEDTRNG